MRTHRIYFPFSSSQKEILLSKESRHHLVNVLRCREGEVCDVFDGDGHEVRTKISQIKKSQIILTVLEDVNNKTESPLKIHLFQALCKGDKMDVIMQKSVELGATEITPLLTERCDVKLSGDRLTKKHQHWHNIIISAAEQSGRALLPRLHHAVSLQEALGHDTDSLRLLLTPQATKKLSALVKAENVSIFIGPEGGFNPSEVTLAETQGVKSVMLGKRILRTETASLAVLASLQLLWGDF